MYSAKHLSRLVVTGTLVLLFLTVSPSRSQDAFISKPFSQPPNVFLFRFDPQQQTLYFRRDVQSNIPAVKGYSFDGTPHNSISPLADFPEDEELFVWDVIGYPQNGTVISAAFKRQDKPELRYRFLFYDASSALKKMWNVFPYEIERIAVDRDGNVFGFGDRVDIESPIGKADYPILMKYSPDGKVIGELLHRSDLPMKEEFLAINSKTGEHFLFMQGDTLVLYVATTKELFTFGVNGKLIRRVSVAPFLSKMSESLSASSCQFDNLAPSNNQGILAQLKCFTQTQNKPGFAFQLVEISMDGALLKELGPATETLSAAFLGSGTNGLIYLSRSSSGQMMLTQRDAKP